MVGNGIGEALCERFSQIGLAGLAVIDLDGEAAHRVADRCGGHGFAVDVTDESSLAQAIKQTEEKHGRVDIVVSNAGIGFADGSEGWATSCPNDRWQKIWEVNVMAHGLCRPRSVTGHD